LIPLFITPPPYRLSSNLILKVPVFTEGFTIDPSTGNEIPNRKIVELKAIVVKASDSENQYRQPGSKIESIEIKGYIQCGKVSIPLTATYPAILKGRTQSEDQHGELDFQVVATPSIKEISKSIGLPILGIFRRIE
jgi:hypothetical protein